VAEQIGDGRRVDNRRRPNGEPAHFSSGAIRSRQST
jgi:hypothetical protein